MEMVLGQNYSFNTHAPAILGATLKNLKLVGQITYEQARTMDNVDLRHRQIYTLLPPGTPDNPRQYNYYLFVTLGVPWIIENSIENVTTRQIKITITDIPTTKVNRLKESLAILGIINYVLEDV